MYWLKLMSQKYRAPEDEGSGGGGGEDEAAKAAALKAAEEAKKAAEEEEKKKASKLSEKEHELLKEVMDKKAKIKTLEANLSEVNEKLKALEGVDPAKIKELLKAQREAEEKALEAKGEYETVKKQMLEAHKTELTEVQKKIQELQEKLDSKESTIDKLTIGSAFANSKFIGESLTLPPSKAQVLFGAHFERDEDGRVVGYNKPKGASGRAPLVDGTGEPLSFDQALAKLVEADSDKDTLLRAKAKPGAGSDTNANGSGKGKDDEVGVGRSRILAGIQAKKLSEGKRLNLKQ